MFTSSSFSPSSYSSHSNILLKAYHAWRSYSCFGVCRKWRICLRTWFTSRQRTPIMLTSIGIPTSFQVSLLKQILVFGNYRLLRKIVAVIKGIAQWELSMVISWQCSHFQLSSSHLSLIPTIAILPWMPLYWWHFLSGRLMPLISLFQLTVGGCSFNARRMIAGQGTSTWSSWMLLIVRWVFMSIFWNKL